MQRNYFPRVRGGALGVALSCLLIAGPLLGPRASADEPLKVFGYFQTEFFYDRTDFEDQRRSSFVLQHLNLLLQKDLGRSWSSYVNFEFINSYNSSEDWGSFNIQEAWLRYRYDNRLNIKLGLHIPTFNNLNEIKNRTPLLPYIIRPVVYESSLEDVISLDQYVPNRAYVQAYGFLPLKRAKIDYAFYLGNSPNINSDTSLGQTGVDTTDTYLVGGRVGVRYEELKVGVSGTFDQSNFLFDLLGRSGLSLDEGEELDRFRLGFDLSYRWGGFFFESEYIKVIHDEEGQTVDLDLYFYYGLLGYEFSDRLQGYVMYMATEEDVLLEAEEQGIIQGPVTIDEDQMIRIPTVGLAYRITDRISAKAQYAHVRVDVDIDAESIELNEDYFALAISAFF